jgi:bacteriorhodopsin
MADIGVNIFLLCVSIFELLFLQIGHMRDKVKWEAMWVIFVECAAYGSSIISPDEGFVTFHLENGMRIEWLRYAGWILTCPVLLMTLVSMTTAEGTKPPTVRMVPLLVCNLTMVLFGVTSGSVLQPTKWYIFGIGVIFGGVVFSNVIQCLSALYWDSQTDSIRLTSLMLAITFVVGWGIFPLNFVIGHSGLDLVSEQVYITNFVIGDLLSKNAWVAIAVLRNHQVEMHNLEQEMIESQHNQEQPKVRLALQQIEVQRFEQEGDWRNNPRLARRGSNSTLILNEVNSSSGRTPERQRQHSTRGVTPTMRT